MGLALPQVLISSLLSHVQLFFSGLATCQVEGEKNQPQEKKRFDTDLLASALKDCFVLALYPSTNIPFGCFFIILHLQTCCSRPFYTACQRWLLTPEQLADRGSLFCCPKSSLALLRALSQTTPEGGGEQVPGPGGPKVARADNGFPLRVSGGRGNKGGEDLVLAKTTVVFSGDSDIKTERGGGQK